MRGVYCSYCGKPILEGQNAVQDRCYTGFYCDWKCYGLQMQHGKAVTVTNELVEEDKECTGRGWEEI